jgi:pimeloyl-ACP methyl ester carboxylesterase
MKVSREKIGNAEVRVWRGGKGAPLLYLHGFEQHPGGAPFLEKLCETFEVCAPESPGFGQSSGLDEMHDLLDMALHIRAVVEGWDRGAVNVIGHSLGGMFAAELAVIAPQLTKRLVLVDPFGLWLDDEPLPDPFIQAPDALAKLKWHNPANANKEPSAFDEMTDGSRHTFRTINLSAATKYMWPIPDRGLARRARYIQAPTLILHGESDRLIPLRYSEALAKLIPGAEMRRLRDAGHYPMIEAEEPFLDAVQSFFLVP